MALQADFQAFNGAKYLNTYIRLTQYRGSKNEAELDAAVFENEAARQANELPISLLPIGFEYDTDSKIGIMQQGYAALKELEQLSNIKDV